MSSCSVLLQCNIREQESFSYRQPYSQLLICAWYFRSYSCVYIDLQKSRGRERVEVVLFLLSTRGQTFWRPVLCLQHFHQSFHCLSFQSPLQSNQIILEAVNVQAQGNYIRCYFSCEQHIKFWILPLLQISTTKFFTSFLLIMSRHLRSIIYFFIPL